MRDFDFDLKSFSKWSFPTPDDGLEQQFPTFSDSRAISSTFQARGPPLSFSRKIF